MCYFSFSFAKKKRKLNEKFYEKLEKLEKNYFYFSFIFRDKNISIFIWINLFD